MSITINSLDPSQQQVLDALINADCESSISVVYGPPGTGKSHLIVSLLFELATKKNKVLFVSQNTEALEVISRMVKKIEKTMKLTNDHLSFLDFCLMLNRSEQRRLKYIKSQRDRVFIKELRSSTHTKHVVDMEKIPYALSYTHLDKIQNENLPEDVTLGLDELLANYLHNAKTTNMLGSVVKSLSSINIRQVFELLRSFNDEHNRFSDNNHPTNSLKFISKNNLKVTMPETHAVVGAITDTVSKMSHAALNLCQSMQDTEIIVFLQLLSKLAPFQETLDLYRIQQSAINIVDFSGALRNAVSEFEAIEDTDCLDIPEKYTSELFVPLVSPDSLETLEIMDNLSEDAKNVIRSIARVLKLGVSEEQVFDVLLLHSLASINLGLADILVSFPGLKEYDQFKLRELLTELETWSTQNSFQKHLKKRSPILLNIAEGVKAKDIDAISQYSKNLSLASNIIGDTTLTIGALNKLMLDAKVQKSAVNPLSNIKRDGDKSKLLNDLLIIRERASFFCDFASDQSITDIKNSCERIITDSAAYSEIVEKNAKQAGHATVPEIIKCINCNIRNCNRLVKIEPIVEKYKKYIKSTAEGISSFIEVAQRILGDIGDGNTLERALNYVLVPDGPLSINSNAIDSTIDQITGSLDSGIFSDEFYKLKQNDNVQMWCDRISTIRNFANIDEFDGFVEQNRFIAKLKELMGQDNASDIDSYLNNDPVSFEDFAEKITNDLVKAKYQSLPVSMRMKISSKEYFGTFQKELAEERKNYFLEGLYKLKLASENPAKQLKYDSNWKGASSVMEKLRVNSEMIADAFPVIIATPKEVSKYLKPKKAMFDYVVFDEASQLLPGQALPSIYRAEKAIIVGDPHQMPPTLSTTFSFDSFDNDYDEDAAENENDVSILDIAIPLADSECQHHLKVHYRSESNKLFEPSRKAIYAADGIQPIFEAKSDKLPIDIKDNLGPVDADNFAEISRRVMARAQDDPNATFCLLFTRKDKSGEQGFKNYITQNQSSSRVIYDLIESGKLLVSTVTNCQGIEGDHSIIYFNHYDNPGSMWFFNEKAGAYKRLNVAITRQRKSLDILMADSRGKWLTVCQNYTQPGTSPNRLRSAELMMSLLTNAGQEVDEDYLEDLLGPNSADIDSPLTQELYNRLITHYDNKLGSDIKIWCEVGWNMIVPDSVARDRNKKNVGYRLDIGIYSPKKKRFVLGIEMDGATYHSGFAKEFADQQRQEILEMKGWHVYRIWSTNWLNDSDAEFNALVEEIDKLLENNDFEISEIDTDIDHETYLTSTEEARGSAERDDDGSLNKEALLRYLKRSELDGTPIDIKYLKPDIAENEAVFKKMYIESLDDDYVHASFDEDGNKVYRYSIDRIIDYR